MPPWRVRA